MCIVRPLKKFLWQLIVPEGSCSIYTLMLNKLIEHCINILQFTHSLSMIIWVNNWGYRILSTSHKAHVQDFLYGIFLDIEWWGFGIIECLTTQAAVMLCNCCWLFLTNALRERLIVLGVSSARSIFASLFTATSSSQTDFLSKGGPMLPKVVGSYCPSITIWEKLFSAAVQKLPGNYSDWSGLGHVPVPWPNFHGQRGRCLSPQKPYWSEGVKVLRMNKGYP